MKEITAQLRNHLHNSTNYIACAMYDLELANGDVFYFCEFDKDVFYNGKTYNHNMNIATPAGLQLGSNVTVDKLSLTIYTDASDTIEGAKFMELARNGGLDRANLTMHRCFVDEKGEVIGAIKLFSGVLEVRSGGGITLKLDVKSRVQSLNIEWPYRRYYPNCPYSLYSTACGVNKERYKVQARITAVRGSNAFTIDVAKDNGYFNNGAIYFMSGKLAGVDATIKSNNGGNITLLSSLEETPKVGDMVKLYPGCDKTYSTCRGKFSNGNRNRSTPFVPLKEAVI